MEVFRIQNDPGGQPVATDPKNSSLEKTAIELPEKPLVVIRSRSSWPSLDLHELWDYRDLLFILIERDIKVRYKQTVLGVAWAVIQPLFAMLIFAFLFGRLANIPSDGIPYPIFAYAGLLPWVFFSNAVTSSGTSLISSTNLITKVYFPRMIIPIAVVLAGIVDFLIAFGLFIFLKFYYKVALSPNIIIFPLLLILTTMTAIGIGLWTSALTVKYRDVRHVLPFAIQLLMFATPIIYPSSLVPDKWRWLLLINPLSAQIEGYRSAFFNRSFDWLGLIISGLITIMILCGAAYNFRRMEKSFADVI